MRCPNCGTDVAPFYSFCTSCGEPMPEQQDQPQEPTPAAYEPPPVRQQPRTPTRPAAPPNRYPGDYYPPVTPSGYPPRTAAAETGNNRWMLYTLIGFLAALVVVFGVLLGTGALNRDTGNDTPKAQVTPGVQTTTVTTAQPTVVPTETTPTPTATPAPTPTPTPAPTLTAADRSAITSLISYYLDAFIYDVNNGSYSSLYSYVQSGSPMETQLKNFIANDCVPLEQQEELHDHTIVSITLRDQYTAIVVTTEFYEIWQNEEPYHWWINQKCTYRIVLQSNGQWAVAEYADTIKKIDRGIY